MSGGKKIRFCQKIVKNDLIIANGFIISHKQYKAHKIYAGIQHTLSGLFVSGFVMTFFVSSPLISGLDTNKIRVRE